MRDRAKRSPAGSVGRRGAPRFGNATKPPPRLPCFTSARKPAESACTQAGPNLDPLSMERASNFEPKLYIRPTSEVVSAMRRRHTQHFRALHVRRLQRLHNPIHDRAIFVSSRGRDRSQSFATRINYNSGVTCEKPCNSLNFGLAFQVNRAQL
jgi:hypothetical protein